MSMQVTIPFFLFGDIQIPGSVKEKAFIKDNVADSSVRLILCRSMFANTCQENGKIYVVSPMGRCWMKMKSRMKKAYSALITELKGRDQNESRTDIPSFLRSDSE